MVSQVTSNKSPQIITQVMTITPAIAKAMLASMDKNRPLSPKRVKMYIAMMERGEWDLNGESIIFNTKGQLVDGQHRCHAVIGSGVSIQALVVRNVEPKAQASMNTGYKRAAAHVLNMRGHSNATTAAATVRWILDYERPEGLTTAREFYSNKRIATELEARPNITASVSVTASWKLVGIVPPSAIAFCHYIFSQKDRDLADNFFARLSSGESLRRGNPILTVRQRLIRASLNRVGGPQFRIDQIELLIRAWNALRQGRPLFRSTLGDSIPNVV